VTLLALALLLLASLAPLLVLTLRKSPRDPTVALGALAAALVALAAIVAAVAGPCHGWRRAAALVLAVAAATTAGSDVVRGTFRVIRGELLAPRRHHRRPVDDVDDRDEVDDDVGDDIDVDAPGSVLRGGAWVGYLERAAISATLLAGWPEGMALVLAVKGVGRYPELRGTESVQSHAPETFIIGTLASVLWAAACAGVAVLISR
jgi:hypothetical protein